MAISEIETDAILIRKSGIFDEQYYQSAAKGSSPVEHYLSTGWSSGYEPSPAFDGAWLSPFFASAGFPGPPATTFAMLKLAGLPTYANRGQAEETAKIIQESGLFDATGYSKRLDNLGALDPLMHYILIGERIGYPPSAHFDPRYYMERYPDVALHPVSLLRHYLTEGKKEGRRPTSLASDFDLERVQLDPNRETILLVSHQASRTGAPILAYNIAKRLSKKYNIITIILLPGELTEDFRAFSNSVFGPLTSDVRWAGIDGVNYVEAKYLARRIQRAIPIKYAIVNSIDSRTMLKPLACELIPTVTLVHEFAGDLRKRGEPPGEMGRWLEWTDEIVFSARMVADLARDDYPHLKKRSVHILPQGPCDLPPRELGASVPSSDALISVAACAQERPIILGCGTVFERKGVDLFIECAARLQQTDLRDKFKFVWIGQGFDPTRNQFSRELDKRIQKFKLNNVVALLDEVTDLDQAYASASIFFLSSRLDPLPNVGIDSALRGIPIVCFDGAGGIAELLNGSPLTSIGVVPYLDVEKAANTIAMLLREPKRRLELGEATKRIASATFDMDKYIEAIDAIGQNAEKALRQRHSDFATISSDTTFDMSLFLEPQASETTRDEAIRLYLARSAALAMSTEPTANFYFRRPCPGFHPQIYAHHHAELDFGQVNPLADFINNGEPSGPWRHEVITPAASALDTEGHSRIRAVIHGHFFYPELLNDFIEKLNANSRSYDLLLSTNSAAKARQLTAYASRYTLGDVTIEVFPNRGRDLGPFLTGFSDAIRKYDVVGHFHSKRSLHAGDQLGDRWREFLWQNLIGGLYPMADTICHHFETHTKTGLIFADDPHLCDWDYNREFAQRLITRMGRSEALPPYFDFPVGTMFWARTRALQPLIDLSLSWDSYPKEPLPIDGTLLHAIERLLPFVAELAGCNYASTYVPGMTW